MGFTLEIKFKLKTNNSTTQNGTLVGITNLIQFDKSAIQIM